MYFDQELNVLKPVVKRWVLSHKAQVNEDNAKVLERFFRGVGYTDDGPVCQILVFRMPYYGRPSSSLCMPVDARLVRNHVQENIAHDVDLVEESSFATLGFLLVETIAIIVLLVLHCVRVRRPEPPSFEGRDERRRTIYEATLDAIRI